MKGCFDDAVLTFLCSLDSGIAGLASVTFATIKELIFGPKAHNFALKFSKIQG